MKTLLLFILLFPLSLAQNLTDSSAKKFIELLISDSEKLNEYVFRDEFVIANRFAIEYEGVKNKFLIANEIPLDMQKDLQDGKIKYNYTIKKLEDNLSLLTINIGAQNFRKEYLFKDSQLISHAYFHSRNWQKITTDYFVFYISDKTLFNDYSILQLENFVKKMIAILDYSDTEIEKLKQQKIYYYLCKDENEINKLTGFTIRGIYNLAYDYIITTYNTHYHELLHFLINNKLKKLPLYTHPFLQEGFAVSCGGRGGLEAHTILEMGAFLIKSGFCDYKELLSKTDFQKVDASISYSVSGLYMDFLIKQTGINDYLKLYLRYSGDSEKVFSEIIDTSEFPTDDKWQLYVDSISNQNPIKVKDEISAENLKLLHSSNGSKVYEIDNYYYFKIKDTLLVSSLTKIDGYSSKIFRENFPDRKYTGEKYLIIANQNEVSVYNLYTNNLIGKYVASFTLPPKNVIMQNGYYEFLINKNLFDEEITELSF